MLSIQNAHNNRTRGTSPNVKKVFMEVLKKKATKKKATKKKAKKKKK